MPYWKILWRVRVQGVGIVRSSWVSPRDPPALSLHPHTSWIPYWREAERIEGQKLPSPTLCTLPHQCSSVMHGPFDTHSYKGSSTTHSAIRAVPHLSGGRSHDLFVYLFSYPPLGAVTFCPCRIGLTRLWWHAARSGASVLLSLCSFCSPKLAWHTLTYIGKHLWFTLESC